MRVKIQRKNNAAPVSHKAKPAGKVRRSSTKTTSAKSNERHPLSAYEHLHIGIVESSLDGKYIEANEEFCRILGYPKEELLRLSIKDCTHEDDYGIDVKLHQQLVNGEIPFYGLEKRYVQKSGGIIWVELTRSLVHDEGGQPLCTLGVVIDISERKQVERVLRESAENLRLATEAARMFKWELNFQRQLYTFADNFVQVLGFSAGLLPQNSVETVWRLSPEEDVQAISEAIDEAIKNHSDLSSLQYRMINPEDGQVVWLEVNAKIVYDDQGNAQRMFGVAQNITENKRVEELERTSAANALAAAEANAKFRAFFDQGSYFAGVMTLDGTLVEANRLCLDFCGFTREDVVGKKFWDCGWWNPSPELMDMVRQGTQEAAAGTLFHRETNYFLADGSERYVDLIIVPVRDEKTGQLLFLAPTGTDITERKQIAEELARERELLTRLFDTMPVMISMFDPETRSLRLNAEFERRAGWKTEEVSVVSLIESLYPDPDYRTQVIQRMAAAERDEWVDVRIQTRDGRTLDSIWSNASILKGMQIGIGVDITERKRAEQSLTEYARQQEALYRLSDALHHTDSLGGVYDATLDAILSGLQCDRASILLFDDTDLMRFVAWRGLSDGYRRATEGHTPWNVDEKNPYPICVGDVDASDLSDSLKATIQAEGIRSLAFIPLVSNSKLIGKFMVYFNAPHDCSDVEIELALMIARQLAFGIDRIKAENALRESEAKLQAEVADLKQLQITSSQLISEDRIEVVYEKIIEAATVLMRSDMASLQMLYPEKNELRLLAWRGFDPKAAAFWEWVKIGSNTTCALALETQQRVIMTDIEKSDLILGSEDFDFFKLSGIRAVQTTPLFSRDGRLVGMISTHWRETHQPSERELSLFDVLARQAADLMERKWNEEALRASEERYRTIVDTANEGIWYVDLNAITIYLNEPMAQMLGYSANEIIGRGVPDFCFDEDIPKVHRRISNNYQGNYENFDFRFRRRDGSEVLVLASTSPVRDANGKVIGALGMFVDITERRRWEEQLRESAQFDAFRVALTDALRPLSDPEQILAEAMRVLGEQLQVDRVLYSEIAKNDETILILDNYVREGVPKLTGRASLNDYGKARGTLRAGQNLIITDAITSPAMDEKDRAIFAALGIRSGLAIPLIKGGRWAATLGVQHGAVRAWTENEVKFVEETAEYTWSALERARAQERLRASEALYRTIARNIPGGGVYVVDRDFRYLVAEGAISEVFGLSRELLEGHKVSEVFLDERGPWLEERLQQVFAGETISFETKHNGRVFWTQLAPLLDSIGQAIILTLDITERKQAEESLRQSEERFVRFMQHLPGLAWIKDIEGHYVYANAAAEKAFNTPRERLYGKTDYDIFPPKVAAQFKKNDEQAFVNEKGMQTIEALLQDDGVLHYSLVTKFPIPGLDGNTALIGGTAFDITERLQAEEALRESEERYRSLFDLVPIAVYTCDANGLIREYNHQAAELWGREPKLNDPEETRYCGSHRLYYLDGRWMPHEECPMGKVLRGEFLAPSETEVLIERPDGSRRHVIVHPLPLRNEHGQIVEAINCIYDITERKRIEEALQIENERFMRFVDSNIVGILIGDASGKVILANDYYLNLLGVSRQDFMDGEVDWKKFTPPEWLSADEKAIQQLQERGVCDPYEKEYVRSDGTRVPVYIADAMLPGPRAEIAAFVLDITQRKQAEQALHASEERLRAILNQATAGIVRQDSKGKLIFVNQAFCNMVGYREEELLGRTTWEFTHEDDATENKRLYERMITEGVPFKLEKRLVRRDGSILWVDVSVDPVMDAEGKPQSAVAVEVDITGRKQAEEALQQLNSQLESRVQKRTATIQAMNQSLREEIAERKRIEEALRASEALARESEEKLRTLFDLLPVGITFLDPNGKIIQINSAVLDIVRLSREQLFDQQAYKSRKYIRPDGTPMPISEFASSRALRENKTIYNVETGIILENGEVVWTSSSAAPVDVAGVGVVVVAVDITETKRAERALQESHGRLRILSQRLVEVQEEERRALARELHDRVGQTLAALNINLIIINSQLSPDTAQQIGARLNDSMKLVGETIALVRDVMTDLRPAVLDDYGLEAALESHLGGFKSRYSIEVIFEKPERLLPRLGPSIEMTLLRIAQEALMNIARHAHAEHVRLSLHQEEKAICLTIQDDGIGIESWQNANRPGSHGLTIMRERAEAFGGTLKVRSIPNHGTTVEASIPFVSKNEGQEKNREERL